MQGFHLTILKIFSCMKNFDFIATSPGIYSWELTPGSRVLKAPSTERASCGREIQTIQPAVRANHGRRNAAETGNLGAVNQRRRFDTDFSPETQNRQRVGKFISRLQTGTPEFESCPDPDRSKAFDSRSASEVY